MKNKIRVFLSIFFLTICFVNPTFSQYPQIVNSLLRLSLIKYSDGAKIKVLATDRPLKIIDELSVENKHLSEGRQFLNFIEKPEFAHQQSLQGDRYFEWLTLVVVLLIFLIAIITARAYFLIKRKNRNLEEAYREVNSRNFEIETQKTHLKAALSDKELLMSEIHHRTKNNLLLVQNLLSAQLMEAENGKVRAALSSIKNRLESIRLIYDILYQSNSYDSISLKDYLGNLSIKLLEGFSNAESIQIKLDIEDVSVSKDVIVTIGLIANEILTNSFKHAFNDSSRGLVIFEVRIESEFLKIYISDDGVGIPPKGLRKESLGMRLIDGLSRQLRATYKIVDEFGTRTYIDIPGIYKS